MSATFSITEIPCIQIQPDWDLCFDEQGKSSFWVALSKQGHQVQHGKVSINVQKNDISITDDINFQAIRHSAKVLEVRSTEGTTAKFIAPSQTLRPHGPKQPVNCMDISPKGELGVSGSNNGSLVLWETASGNILREFQGHVGDLFNCRIFPSGQVVLSAGSDLMMKIWSALDGECAATIKGHTGGILDTGMIERGRNIVSCSRDGTLRLWDVSSQTQIALLVSSDKPINCCHVTRSVFNSDSSRVTDSREVGTEGKLVLCGGEDGLLRGVDLRSQQEVVRVNCHSAVNTCTALSENQYVCGTESGVMFGWDARNLSSPAFCIQRSKSSVTSVTSTSTTTQCWCATGDGMCFLYDTAHHKVIEDLTGADCEPIHKVCQNGNHVYTACRDGAIRIYSL